MSKTKVIWLSLTLSIIAVLGALAFLWVGLKSTYAGEISVQTFVLILSLIILLLFGCWLSMAKPVVWVPALSLSVVLLCGLGLLLYLYGWLGGPNVLALGPGGCNCFGPPGENCTKNIVACEATQEALVTQQAPPVWWPLHTPPR